MRKLIVIGLGAAIVLAFSVSVFAACPTGRTLGEWDNWCNVEWLTFPLSPEGIVDCDYACGDDYETIFCDTDLLFWDLGPNRYCLTLREGDYKIAFDCDPEFGGVTLYLTCLNGTIVGETTSTIYNEEISESILDTFSVATDCCDPYMCFVIEICPNPEAGTGAFTEYTLTIAEEK